MLSRSGFAVDFCPPPAHPNEKKAPVLEELRRLALEDVADELEDPAEDEQRKRIKPEAMKKDTRDKDRKR